MSDQKNSFPPQHQNQQPGSRLEMNPRPESEDSVYLPSGKLSGKTVLITGGDSGIGRAIAILFAKEGANLSIVYANEHQDAVDTKKRIEELDRRCVLIPGDIAENSFCKKVVDTTILNYKKIDVLINNAAVQYVSKTIEEISEEQLDKVFRTNIFSMFYLVKHALQYMRENSVIINTTSVTAYEGNSNLLDYSSSKGAIVSFTRSLALMLASRGIRVNAVAPGPIWTPLIPASFDAEHVENFGKNTAMRRAGQPREVAPCYLFLASQESSYMTGQVLHPNGGRIING